MDESMQKTAAHEAESRAELGLGTHTAGKSDLRSTKQELFNKLIANQSQQIIVTTPNKKDGAENLNTANSSTGAQNYQTGTVPTEQLQQQLNHTECSSKLQQQQQQFLPDDIKRDPVVFSRSRNRWYTNEEVASILTNFSSHPEWQTNELQVRPKSGAVLLYSREKVRYRQDGYCWKKRKNGRTTREDHMKLKVQGIECIYGCYVHSAILPTFHRRCYWLLQNPDIVLVHYLNQPPDDQNKMITFNSSLLEADTRRTWTNEEIIEEIGSVFGGISQIQHMLNINFPPTATLIEHQSKQQQQQQLHQSVDLDRINDASPQSQQSTSNSEALNEQVDMTILDQVQPVQLSGCEHQLSTLKNGAIKVEETESGGRDGDEDELMTTLCQDTNNNINETQTNSSASNGLNQTQTTNGHDLHQHQQHHHQQQQHLTGTTMAMTFDVADDRKNDLIERHHHHQQSVDCFGDYANNLGVNNLDDIAGNNDNNMGEVSSREEQTNDRMEQNSCSPVTQIYNKIVDDIETYALPLEPNQFNSNHHHHHDLSMSSLPVQPMDIISEMASHDQHLHNQHNQHHGQQPSEQQQHCNSNHQSRNLEQQFSNSHKDAHEVEKARSVCSMDLVTCDLFGGGPNQSDQSGHDERHGGDEDDNLLLTDFNLPSGVGQVSDELGAGVVDSLNHVDDFRDLIMGISSNGNPDHNNLLVDSNALDIFDFKTSDCEQDRMTQGRQQLNVKSSTSDTEQGTRLSPMVPAPRCNSTGTPVQSASLNLNHQHLSASNFLRCPQSNLIQPDNFFEFHNNLSSHRSSSANPSSSTSCSPSPSSSSSLRTGPLNSARSTCIDTMNQYGVSTNSSTHSSIKLPLQQRQKSEQKEPSNSILNSLLPKALSLDGCDLATTSDHRRYRLSVSPLIAYDQDTNNAQLIQDRMSNSFNQQQTNQTLPTETTATGHHQSIAQHHHLGTPLMSSIPIDNSSELLVNNQDINNFFGSPAYNSNHLQQQQQPIAASSGRDECSTTVNVVLPILDYVPNWSNITGGAKVLIVGNWRSLIKECEIENQNQRFDLIEPEQESEFFAIFDDLVVPATLIQDNVLRCYAPSHEQGFITLKVLYKNRIVSEQVLFEMRPSCIQSSAQVDSFNLGNNQNDGQDPHGDSNNNQNQINGSNSSQHRNSTSSTQSTGAISGNQKPQVSSSGDSASGDNSRVLTLAENIISAMHKKNSNCFRRNDQSKPFGNSLDIEYLDGRKQYNQQFHSRQYSLKGTQRRLIGSRSLSRVELNSSYNYNYGMVDGDPYWHQSSARDYELMQPLSVVTDLPASRQHMSGPVSGQKRHSSESSSYMVARQQQQSTFGSSTQRPTLASMYHNQNVSHLYQPLESQNLTETSSSGLGSIVSSLSPSSSSLHSPSSACNAATKEVSRENQSPCSCGRQSSRTPTSADFCEYFQASARTQESFASLTLNDLEQRELYEAAKIIQKAYRTYRGRKRQASELLVEPNGSGFLENQMETSFQLSNQLVLCSSGAQSDDDSSTIAGNQQECYSYRVTGTCSNQKNAHQVLQQYQSQLQPTLVKCYRDREMQAATIIQAYYRRYRQYVHYNRQQSSSNRHHQKATTTTMVPAGAGVTVAGGGSACSEHVSSNAKLVVDTLPIIIDKATTSHVDRKRFKTASLISGCGIVASGGLTMKEGTNCS